MARLIERQMRNWELACGQQQAEDAPQVPQVFEFVTISRQAGGGGLTLARALGKRIGWEVYDREILNYMANDDGIQKKIYELADEHSEGYFESILKSLGFEGHTPGADYFRKLVGSINAVAHAGHAIFVGRGAGFMLPAERGLGVRVIAEQKVRCERRAQQVGCSLEEAADMVRKQDADRDEFVRSHFRLDPALPEHYDVVVNTGSLSTEAAVEILVAGLEHKTNIHIARPQ